MDNALKNIQLKELTAKEEDFILEKGRERDFEDMPDKDETVYADNPETTEELDGI